MHRIILYLHKVYDIRFNLRGLPFVHLETMKADASIFYVLNKLIVLNSF